MIVKMQERGQGVTGLRIGARNVQRYFTKSVPTVDLDLDSVQIQCELGQAFWQDQPEIIDPRLCSWLTVKNTKSKVDGNKVVLLMLPAGRNSFRLQTRQSRGAAKRESSFDATA
jgi:hypothetical protein